MGSRSGSFALDVFMHEERVHDRGVGSGHDPARPRAHDTALCFSDLAHTSASRANGGLRGDDPPDPTEGGSAGGDGTASKLTAAPLGATPSPRYHREAVPPRGSIDDVVVVLGFFYFFSSLLVLLIVSVCQFLAHSWVHRTHAPLCRVVRGREQKLVQL